MTYGRFDPHQTFLAVMLEIALVGIQFWMYVAFRSLFLPKVYDLVPYVATFITHFQQVFDFFFQLHHSILAGMEWLSTSQCHFPCKMY